MAAIPVAALVPNYYGADLGVSLSAVGTIWLVTFWLGWTMLFIPYHAWAAELSPRLPGSPAALSGCCPIP